LGQPPLQGAMDLRGRDWLPQRAHAQPRYARLSGEAIHVNVLLLYYYFLSVVQLEHEVAERDVMVYLNCARNPC
jgi:hypothetical protein